MTLRPKYNFSFQAHPKQQSKGVVFKTETIETEEMENPDMLDIKPVCILIMIMCS